MSASIYESRIRQKNQQLSSARKKRVDAESKASRLKSDINRLERQASTTKSSSLRDGYLRQAERKAKELVTIEKKASDLLSEMGSTR